MQHFKEFGSCVKQSHSAQWWWWWWWGSMYQSFDGKYFKLKQAIHKIT